MLEGRVSDNQQHGQAQQELRYDEFGSYQVQERSKHQDKDSFVGAEGCQQMTDR